MAKTKISQYDATAANNTDIDSINIAEGMAPSNVNNAIRELMAHLKDMDAGTQALTSPQLTSADINGGTIDGVTIGGASAGAGTFTNLTATGTTTLAGASTSADITFGDNDKAIFGAGSDLQIYHDGSASYIDDTGTGALYIRGNAIVLEKYTGERLLDGTGDAAVKLYYDNAVKLATTSTGIDVTGTAVTDGLTVAGNVSVDGGTIKLDGNYPVGTGNVALGDTALDSVQSDGNYNVAIGEAVLTNVNGADANTAVGYYASNSNTTGTFNVSHGYRAMRLNTSGSYNTALGGDALYSNTTANNNTAVGYQAGYSNTTATANVFMGFQAGYSINAGSGYNTYVGISAGYSTTSGQENTYIGKEAGYHITSGSKNTIIGGFNGNEGGLDIRTSSNNIVLSDGDGNPRGFFNSNGAFKVAGNAGVGDLASITSQAHEFVNELGSSDYTVRISNMDGSGSGFPLSITYGNTFNDTTSRFLTCLDPSAVRMVVYSNGNVQNVNNSYGAYSDVKLKENITDSGSQWDDIKSLRVRKYSMKSDNLDAPNMLGVIAQEVEAAGMGGLVFETSDASPENPDAETSTKQVQYSILYMKAVKALQEAMDRIETLEAKVTALENA